MPTARASLMDDVERASFPPNLMLTIIILCFLFGARATNENIFHILYIENSYMQVHSWNDECGS